MSKGGESPAYQAGQCQQPSVPWLSGQWGEAARKWARPWLHEPAQLPLTMERDNPRHQALLQSQAGCELSMCGLCIAAAETATPGAGWPWAQTQPWQAALGP